ncbi:MAG: nucleotidyltransferase domain-containing protein [Candidatus Bathyarchaeia archaeon]
MPEKLDFITPTMLKILYVFHEDPMRELHEREVMREARVSKGSANNILRKLSELGVLNRERRGRMVFYRLNVKNAVARQFKVLFNVYSLNNLVEEIKHYCKRVILFGSCSEGTDVKESDVDLFVLTNEKDKVKLKINTYQKAEKRIAPIIVDSNEFAKLRKEDKPLYDRILKGIVLWESE